MRPPPPPQNVKKSGKLFIWILALSLARAVMYLSSNGGQNLAISFLDKINFFFLCFIYRCFVGNVAVSVWLASVWLISAVITLTEWRLSLWMPIGHYGLYGPYLYDYHLYYPAHQCVNVWPYQSMYESMYYIQSYLSFFLLLKLFLLYFLVVK